MAEEVWYEPPPDIARLLARYSADAQLWWVTSEFQRHCYAGPRGATGPIPCLCGQEVVRCEQPSPGARFTTCPVCHERSVWIRCRRPPAGQLLTNPTVDGEVAEDRTRPHVRREQPRRIR